MSVNIINRFILVKKTLLLCEEETRIRDIFSMNLRLHNVNYTVFLDIKNIVTLLDFPIARSLYAVCVKHLKKSPIT
jgi:hypothetical protein